MNIDLWKTRKKELKLTHDELAELSGISRRTIAGIFGGDPRYASPTLCQAQSIPKKTQYVVSKIFKKHNILWSKYR